MYTWHAWIQLYDDERDRPAPYEQDALAAVRAKARELELRTSPDDPISCTNGGPLFQASGAHDHRGSAHQRLHTLLRFTLDVLPGSWGLVYWRDDETPGTDAYDGYRVLVLARGAIADRLDPFLSPLTVPENPHP